MKQRAITSIFIVLTVVLAVVSKLLPMGIGDYIFDVFIALISIIAGLEMCNIMDKLNKPVSKYLTSMYPVFNYVILLVCLDSVKYYFLPLIQIGALAAYFVVIMIFELIKNKGNCAQCARTSLNSIVACIYPSFLFGLFLNINHMDVFAGVEYFSLMFVIMVFAVTMLSDTFAYLVGRTFKGPKLAPKISPNKTISGGIGGLLGGVLGAMLVYLVIYLVGDLSAILVMYGLSWWHFALIGLLGSVVSQCGDLFESYIKRRSNIKDSSELLPGHGGMLDRIDAMTFCVAFIFIVIIIILA